MVETRKPTKKEQKALGAMIRDARVSYGLTQDELAEEVGCSPHWISNIERGKSSPNWRDAMLLGAMLGLTLEQILKGVNVDVPVLTSRKQDEFTLYR